LAEPVLTHASLERELTRKSSAVPAKQEKPYELITIGLGQEVFADRAEIYF
jgi:hypothetical protein